MASADVLLHPVRLRIIQAFLGERALTTAQLAAELPDVPPGSLYRHVAILAKEGVLAVAAERRVRGALERTWILRLSAAQLSPSEIAAMSPADHAHAFGVFVAQLLGDFERYLASEDPAPDPARDGAGYRLGAAWLTDAELEELLADLAAQIRPRLANGPAPGRRRRILAGVVIPAEPAPKPRRRTPSKPAASKATRSNRRRRET